MSIDLTSLSAEELTALAREATIKAKETRAKAGVQMDTMLSATRAFVAGEAHGMHALRSLFPGTIHVRIAEDGTVTSAWKRGRRVKNRHRVPRPPLVYAYYAKQRTSLSVAAILPKIELAFGAPWPGETPTARRNSLKAALARILPTEKAVAKLRTPKAIRNWASKQSGAGYRKAAEAMIALASG